MNAPVGQQNTGSAPQRSPSFASKADVDHLVLVADNLEQGHAWVQKRMGVAPVVGGQHAFMGTHNCLLSIASPGFEHTYLEVIAIDPSAAKPPHARWFGMDNPALQAAAKIEPRWVHWVASCSDIEPAHAALRRQGFDLGEIQSAQRGSMRWQISIRADGQLELGGRLPSLIQWQGARAGDSLPRSSVRLQAINLALNPVGALDKALSTLGLQDRVQLADLANSFVRLQTPAGDFELEHWHESY